MLVVLYVCRWMIRVIKQERKGAIECALNGEVYKSFFMLLTIMKENAECIRNLYTGATPGSIVSGKFGLEERFPLG